MDVLIVRPGALGDSILTLPVLHALRLAGARNIKILGTPASWAFLRPGLKQVSLHDFGSSDCLGLFQSEVRVSPVMRKWIENVSSAIVYLPGDTTAIQNALRTLGIREVVCCPPPIENANPAHSVHAAEQLLSGSPPWVGNAHKQEALKINFHSDDEFIRSSPEETQTARRTLPDRVNPIAIHPGSGGRRKCWPATQYATLASELAARHNLYPLIFLGPADDKVRAEFQSTISPTLPMQWVIQKSLREALALLTLCNFYIGNDSGISHLAGRACRSTILFGPTDPNIWSPIGKNVSIIRAANGNLAKLGVPDVLNRLIAQS